MMISLLVPLAILASVAYLITRNLRGRAATLNGGRPAPHPPAVLREAIGRFFRLGLLLAAVVLSAEGVAGLVAEVWRGNEELLRDTASLARSLAFTVVGLPVLAGLAWWTRRCLTRDPNEPRSSGWATYLGVATSLALVVGMSAWQDILRWTFQVNDFDGRNLGRLLTWSIVWAAHWWLAAARPADVATRENAPILFGSAAGLVTVSIGAGVTLRNTFRTFYDEAFLTVLAGDYNRELRRSLATAAVGAVLWWWYWRRNAATRQRTSWWYAFVLLLGVLGGLVTFVVGAARLLHATLQWVFGNPQSTTAATHFALLPGALATTLVGCAIWWYHRSVLSSTGRRARLEVDRIYQYLAAAVGLVTTAIGSTAAIAALLDAVAGPDSLSDRSPVANAVVLAATLLTVGGPTWLVFWLSAQRRLSDVIERQSITRRVYLFLLFGVAAATALIGLVVLLVDAFEDLTLGEAGMATLFSIRVPLGLVVTTAVIAVYHAVVYREDRAAAPPAPPPDVQQLPREVILLSSDSDADALEAELGTHVRRWRAVDGSKEPSPLDRSKLVAALQATADQHILVLVRPDGTFEVVPFNEV